MSCLWHLEEAPKKKGLRKPGLRPGRPGVGWGRASAENGAGRK